MMGVSYSRCVCPFQTSKTKKEKKSQKKVCKKRKKGGSVKRLS